MQWMIFLMNHAYQVAKPAVTFGQQFSTGLGMTLGVASMVMATITPEQFTSWSVAVIGALVLLGNAVLHFKREWVSPKAKTQHRSGSHRKPKE